MPVIRRRSFLALLCLTICGLTLSLIMFLPQNRPGNLSATPNSQQADIDRMYTVFFLCGDIAGLTGNTIPCDGVYIDPSATSSPLPMSAAPLSGLERTATKTAHQYAITATLSVICPSLAALHVASDSCIANSQ